MSTCNRGDPRHQRSPTRRATGRAATFKHTERNESDIIVADPLTGEIKKRVHIAYPNNSGALSTAGGLVFTGFTDGTFARL